MKKSCLGTLVLAAVFIFPIFAQKYTVDTNDYSVVEINTQHCGNPLFNSFKFTLVEEFTLIPEEWQTFWQEKIKNHSKK